MAVAVRTVSGKWTKATRVPFADEQALQQLLYDSPELLMTEEDRPAVFVREAGLPGSGNTDLLGVDREGDIILIETKLARNLEIRRKVVGQILEYAAHLWGMSFDALDRLFQNRPPHRGLVDLLKATCADIDADELRVAVQRNLEQGTFQLIIAVDEMNRELQKIINYVAERGDGLSLAALEVKLHRCEDHELLVLEHHGATHGSGGTQASTPTITEAQMLANCPDETSRLRLGCLLRRWREMGHEIVMGTQGASFRADVAGQAIPIFWAYPEGIQNAFGKHLTDRGVPVEALAEYRTSVSQISGFDPKKTMQRSQPITKWTWLPEESVELFLRETESFVNGWASSLRTSGMAGA